MALDSTTPFDTSTALATLDGIVHGSATPVPGASSAWDAAWIACLTNNPTWAARARDEFLRMAGELRGSGQDLTAVCG